MFAFLYLFQKTTETSCAMLLVASTSRNLHSVRCLTLLTCFYIFTAVDDQLNSNPQVDTLSAHSTHLHSIYTLRSGIHGKYKQIKLIKITNNTKSIRINLRISRRMPWNVFFRIARGCEAQVSEAVLLTYTLQFCNGTADKTVNTPDFDAGTASLRV